MKNLTDYLLCLYLKVMGVIRSEKGQTLVEYALLLVLIAIVVILMMQGTGKSVCNVYSKINSSLQ